MIMFIKLLVLAGALLLAVLLLARYLLCHCWSATTICSTGMVADACYTCLWCRLASQKLRSKLGKAGVKLSWGSITSTSISRIAVVLEQVSSLVLKST
jgi:hypothetical protein